MSPWIAPRDDGDDGRAPVVVAGAGIAGLTLALALARRGIAVRMYERAGALAEIGAGLQLAPNACRALDALGLGPTLDAVAIEPARLAIRSGRSGAEIAHLPLDAARRRWGAPYRLVRRAALQDALAAAAREAGAEIVLGDAVTGFAGSDDGMAVRLAGGGVVAAPALIGADGLFSAVRRGLGDSRAPRGSEAIAWRAVLPPETRPAGIAAAEISLWLGNGGHVVAYPLDRAGSLNVVACLPGAVGGAAPVPGDGSDLRRLLRSWAPTVQALAAAAADWTVWPLLDRAPGHFPGRGAVALIGDAAHPALPHLAQGAALAIEDATMLAAVIAGPLRLATLATSPVSRGRIDAGGLGESSPAPAEEWVHAKHGGGGAGNDLAAAFRRFERARNARVARVQTEARSNGRVYSLGPLPARARDLVLGTLGPERLMARYDWLYGESS
ncbi:MAG TPA: FAD-dependent monooxygenase [Hyphomicrobiales bacterium]|nr:FAD-dependent monooxygenase [Hyphomicrobiales bacterium]